jgi:hypothetical protein
MASRFSSDITTSTDKDGLVITTAQKVLHVTCVNGLPWVWFNDTPSEHFWSNRPIIVGMTPEGAAFRESARPHEQTFEDLLAREEADWAHSFILGGLTNEERLVVLKEYVEMKGGKELEDYNAEVTRCEAHKKESEAKDARRKAAAYKFLSLHPVGSKLEVHGKTYRILEYSWESIRCVQLGKYDIASTKEINFLKYAVLAQDLQIDTEQACRILSGEDSEEEQHG